MSIFVKSIFILFLLFSFNQLSAQRIIPDEKRLDYSCETQALREVLFDISEITEVTIAWKEQNVPSDALVTLSVRNEKLGKVLEYILYDYQLTYKIVGNSISIIKDPLAEANNLITVSGYILDGESGEALVDAHIHTMDKKQYSFSNEYGFYSITLPKGLQRINVSYIAYNRSVQEFQLVRDTVMDFQLAPSNYIKEVLITDLKQLESPEYNDDLSSSYTIPLSRLKRAVSLAGESDIVRTAMTSSGVSSGTDGFGGLSVRGGSENQNLILFDGIPVYSSNHAFGLFSIFNSDVIKSAKLYKGTFPAHYSGRLSSVLDIRTREGNAKTLKANVSLGLFTAKASIEGPIIKDKASFIISARRTFVDPWIETATEALNSRIGKQGGTRFYFYDINGKLNFKVGKHSRIFLSYYSGKDLFDSDVTTISDDNRIELSNRSEVFWETGNQLMALRWSTRLSQKHFSRLNVYYSDYSFNAFDHNRIENRDLASSEFIGSQYDAGLYKSRIIDRGARLEMDYLPAVRHSIKYGGAFVRHDFRPGLLLSDQSDNFTPAHEPVTKEILENQIQDPELLADEFEFFVSDEIKIGQYSRLNLGYNHLFIKTAEDQYSLPQPRILFSTGSDNYTFKASWGRSGQFLHSLVNTGLGVPIDVWLPSTDRILPEQSWMISNAHIFKTRKLGVIGLEFFYKEMTNLARYSENGNINITAESNWENLIPQGDGYSYGTEFSIEKNFGKTSYYLNYTLSWSNRKFDEVNGGEQFRFRYDRRHIANVSVIHRLGPDVDFSVNWHYGSGAPVTIPTGAKYYSGEAENEQGQLVIVYDGVNNAFLPAYHRLDLGFNFRNKYTWGQTQLTLGLYNAYNRQNTFYRDIVVDLSSPENPVRYEDITLLPVLPSLSYSIQF